MNTKIMIREYIKRKSLWCQT